jgi:hypothetical protein
VKRNSEQFLEDFMFQLTRSEAEEVRRTRSQTVTLKRGQNIKYLPYAWGYHAFLFSLVTVRPFDRLTAHRKRAPRHGSTIADR